MCFKYFCVFVMVKVSMWELTGLCFGPVAQANLDSLHSFLAADIYSRAPAEGDTREALYSSVSILG